MKKLSFFAASFVLAIIASAFLGSQSVRAAVGKNTCIISTCHASDKPSCVRETKLAGLVCSMQAEAADFCVSFIKCGANKKGQCVVTSDTAFKACKSCVVDCLGEGRAADAPLSQRIACQQRCVAQAMKPAPKTVVKK